MIFLGLVFALALQPDPAMIRRIFEDALAQRRNEFGAADARTAQAARDLGLFLIREHDAAAARAALAEAVSIDEKTRDTKTLSDVADLAGISPPEQAAPLWMRAAKSTDPAIASRGLSALGELREAAGDRAAAAEFYRQALAREEAASGRDGAPVAVRLVALALVTEPLQALPLLQRALVINRKQHGERHPETATVEINLAGALLAAGRMDEAIASGRQALNGFESTVGEEHPRTAAAASNLADAYRAKGDRKQAEQLYRRAWTIDRAAYGPKHPETLADIQNLADFLNEIGRQQEAKDLLSAAHE
ncbi:MAG: tetratricopeptide repeat protein [Bryobacteraceae bacterium]